jgi:uncharacterized protein DUF1059
MQKVLHCDCGFEARGEDEDELIREVQQHALDAHDMAITRAQALALAARAEPDESTTGRERT